MAAASTQSQLGVYISVRERWLLTSNICHLSALHPIPLATTPFFTCFNAAIAVRSSLSDISSNHSSLPLIPLSHYASLPTVG